jgi:putative acetyltransferase
MIRGVFDEYGAPTEGTVYVDPTTDHLSKVFDAKGSVLLSLKTEIKL